MKSNILLYIVLVLVIIGIAYSVYAAFKIANYNKFVQSENQEDICKTPSGYTDQQWTEHMSHHPDRYEECLK